jgi:alanine-glyoxylate transaminase/serine-glyoxylate transaminase/serine-pyruvate transaminase
MFSTFKSSPLLWLGAGPSEPAASVIEAMGRRAPTHVDVEAVRLTSEIKEMLQQCLQTKNDKTLILPFPGSGAVQTALEAFVTPKTEVVIGGTGLFSRRIENMVSRLGAKSIYLEHSPGEALDPMRIEEALRANPNALLSFVCDETSTGTVSDANALVEVARALSRPVIIDAVTSAPAAHMQVDKLANGRANEIPLIVASCGQKRFGGPQSASPITINDAGWGLLKEKTSPTPTWLFDLEELVSKLSSRAYHFTTPMPLLQGMHEALRVICAMGLPKLYLMQSAASQAFEAAVSAAENLEFYFPSNRSNGIKCVKVPNGIEMNAVIKQLRDKFSIEISPGPEAKYWRIGLLAPETLTLGTLQRFFEAFVSVLNEFNGEIEPDAVFEALESNYR